VTRTGQLPSCRQPIVVTDAGCVAVPTNPRATGPELRRQLSDASAAAAIVLDGFYGIWRDGGELEDRQYREIAVE
jgi:hypothetical protein